MISDYGMLCLEYPLSRLVKMQRLIIRDVQFIHGKLVRCTRSNARYQKQLVSDLRNAEWTVENPAYRSVPGLQGCEVNDEWPWYASSSVHPPSPRPRFVHHSSGRVSSSIYRRSSGRVFARIFLEETNIRTSNAIYDDVVY